jgi:hypothetical protein
MLSLKQKFFIYLGIALIIFSLAISLGILPLIYQVKESSQKYLANQQDLMRLDLKESLYKDIYKSYKETEKDILKAESAFLNFQETVGFISTLEKVAEETGNFFEIKSAVPANSSSQERYLYLNIFVQGSFESLLQFIAYVEDSPYPPYRLIEIEEISIEKNSPQFQEATEKSPEADLAKNNLRTNLGVKVYLQ